MGGVTALQYHGVFTGMPVHDYSAHRQHEEEKQRKADEQEDAEERGHEISV